MAITQNNSYNVILNQLEIQYPNNSVPLDLRLVYDTLEIYEDLYGNSVSGKLIIQDTNNLIQNGPILGFEKLAISFQTPGKQPISNIFQIYNITDRVPFKERSNFYSIEFCSTEQITNLQTSVSKAYTGMLISDIATDIQENILNSDFNAIETTKFLYSFIIPVYWTPFRTLKWLATRSNSNQYSGANFFYFQNKYGYNFVSLENLINSQPVAVNYFYGPVNIKIDKQTTALSPTLENNRNIEKYSIDQHINIMDNLASGMYSNHLQNYDFLNKTFNKFDFNYSDSYDDFEHLENPEKYNILTQQTSSTKLIPDFLQNQSNQNSVYRYFPDSGSYDFPNRNINWLQQRISQLQEINNIKVKLIVPGDSERTIGDIVNLYLPSNQPINNQQILDNYFQGQYLITSLKHLITKEKYTTFLEICKDSLFSGLPY